MSQPTADSTGTRAGTVATALSARGRLSFHTILGAVALVPVVAATALRALRNAPPVLPDAVQAVTPLVTTLAALVPALALVALGATVDRRAERVTLLAAGLFPLLALLGDPAWLPAAGALVAGGGAAVALALRDHGLAPAPTAVAVLGIGALTCSLVGAAGFATVTLRSFGAALAFATLTALPVARSLDTLPLVGWVLATLVVGWVVASAPFVAGAVTLVAFAAGDVPVVLLAAGVGGALVVALASAWHRRWGVAVGALLLLAAGAPATVARGTAVVLGLVVLVATWGRSTGNGGGEASA